MSFPIAVMVSRFNEQVTEPLKTQTLDELRSRGFQTEEIHLYEVPGAVELPLLAQRLAQSGRFEAIIALGAVIRGETGHYDWVCEQASQGLQNVSLAYDLPVIFGILTTETEDQALARIDGRKSKKGQECVDAACEMVALFKRIQDEC